MIEDDEYCRAGRQTDTTSSDIESANAKDLILVGLEALLAALHAGDPNHELYTRVGDLMRNVKGLPGAAQRPGLREALEKIAKQKTRQEWESEFGEEFSGDYVTGYDSIIGIARTALDHPVAVEQSTSPVVDGDVRWAVNVLLEKIATKFEANETMDIWRSDAASTVRSFKHDLAALTSRVSAPVAVEKLIREHIILNRFNENEDGTTMIDSSGLVLTLSEALRAAPSPALDPATVEACAKVAKEMCEKHGSPTGDAYSCGVWDQGVRIEQKIRALAGSVTSTNPAPIYCTTDGAQWCKERSDGSRCTDCPVTSNNRTSE